MIVTKTIIIFYFLQTLIPFIRCQIYPQPEQIHLSVGRDPSTFVITWVTFSSTGESLVQLKLDGTKQFYTISGSEDLFVDGGSLKRKIYMHRVHFNVKPSTKYVYRVGSKLGWSSVYWFRTLPEGTNWSPKFAVYGDLGNVNAKSLVGLQLEAENGDFDMILHVGDMAYNLDTNNAYYGDEFMRQIQPISTIVPYMVCPGNHERAYNYSNYKRRFSMPGGDGEGQFYSFNVGPVHIVSISAEFYYFPVSFGWEQIVNQFYWLENDLKEANLPENRKQRPWIILMTHRPMYCSNNNTPMHCTNVDNLIRVGVPFPSEDGKTYLFPIEELVYKYGVDLVFGAHEHSYERMWPVYNRCVCNGTNQPYVDPPAPVQIVTGSAGAYSGTDPFFPNGLPWSAFRSDDYGYTRMHIMNSTHLHLEQVSVDKDGKVIDEMTLVRHKHSADMYNCKCKKKTKNENLMYKPKV